MDDAGQKLRRARERLGFRVRDVEQASQRIAEKYSNPEFIVLINRISEIENKGVVPNVYKLYALCAIYRLDYVQALEWYGVPLAALPADSLFAEAARTHAVGFGTAEHGEVTMPLALDPGLDVRRTTYVSRMIQRWGKLPLMFLAGLDPKEQRYGFIGVDDWFMYPLLQPGCFVVLDETRRKVQKDGWTSEFDRPIYFLEHRQGFLCGWCSQEENRLILIPHPASGESPRVFTSGSEVDIIGQVVAVAMSLDQGRRRRGRSSATL
jgi:transcriptional regulator with XRE-family HTH domain